MIKLDPPARNPWMIFAPDLERCILGERDVFLRFRNSSA